MTKTLSISEAAAAYGTAVADLQQPVILQQLVPVSGELQICRDPDDDVILETAIQGNAAYLVDEVLAVRDAAFQGKCLGLEGNVAKTGMAMT